jgi:hypothetical protein
METGYTVHKNGNTTLKADAVTSSLSASNRIARGESVEITLRDVDLQLIVGGGETVVIDDTQAINRVEINSGGTLTVDGTLRADELDNQGTLNVNGTLTVNESVGVELEDIRQYREYAGNATLTETLDGTQRFNETTNTAALDSLVIGVEPNDDLKDRGVRGVWGVVDSVTDARNRQLTTNAITLSLSVLAPYSDFNNVSDVISDLRID